MLTKPIVSALKSGLIDIDNNYSRINEGGCGAFAYLLYLGFISLGQRPKVLILSRNPYEATTINLSLQHGITSLRRINNKGAYCSHVMIKLDNSYYKFWDSTGYYRSIERTSWYYCKSRTYISIHVLEEWIDERNCWNSTFNWKDFDKIRKDLTHLFKHIKQKEIAEQKQLKIILHNQ